MHRTAQVFERLVSMICEKMAESVDQDPSLFGQAESDGVADGKLTDEKPKSSCGC